MAGIFGTFSKLKRGEDVMKKIYRRLMSGLLSVVMVVTLGTPVYAEETETTQTIESVESGATMQQEETMHEAEESKTDIIETDIQENTENQSEWLETEETVIEEMNDIPAMIETETEEIIEETEEVENDYFALNDEYVLDGFKYKEVAKGEVGISGIDNIILSGVVTIPEKIQINNKMYTVTEISYNAFNGCSGVAEFILPETITSIQEQAFAGCTGLKKIVLSENITYVNQNAFKGCNALVIQTASAEVAQILADGKDYQPYIRYVLGDGQILDLNGNRWLNRGYERIGDALYHIVSGKEVEVVDWKTDEIQVTVPSSITVNGSVYSVIGIGEHAFCGFDSRNQSMKTVILPGTIKYIGNSAFEACSKLEEAEIPLTVESIGERAFYGTGIYSTTIPEGVKELKKETFAYCRNLQSVQLPSSLKTIG